MNRMKSSYAANPVNPVECFFFVSFVPLWFNSGVTTNDAPKRRHQRSSQASPVEADACLGVELQVVANSSVKPPWKACSVGSVSAPSGVEMFHST